MSCHKNQISPSVCRPFYYCSVAGDLTTNSLKNTDSLNIPPSFYLSSCFSLNFFFFSPHFYHVHLSFVSFCTSPSLSLHNPSLWSISLLAHRQIWFITFLMLFVIAWHSQHVKSKSFFQRVHLCLVYRDLNQSFVSVVLLTVSISYQLSWGTLNIRC